MKTSLRYGHVCRTLEDCEKPWGVDYGLWRDGGKNYYLGPFKTEAEAKMTLNALRVQHKVQE